MSGRGRGGRGGGTGGGYRSYEDYDDSYAAPKPRGNGGNAGGGGGRGYRGGSPQHLHGPGSSGSSGRPDQAPTGPAGPNRAPRAPYTASFYQPEQHQHQQQQYPQPQYQLHYGQQPQQQYRQYGGARNSHEGNRGYSGGSGNGYGGGGAGGRARQLFTPPPLVAAAAAAAAASTAPGGDAQRPPPPPRAPISTVATVATGAAAVAAAASEPDPDVPSNPHFMTPVFPQPPRTRTDSCSSWALMVEASCQQLEAVAGPFLEGALMELFGESWERELFGLDLSLPPLSASACAALVSRCKQLHEKLPITIHKRVEAVCKVTQTLSSSPASLEPEDVTAAHTAMRGMLQDCVKAMRMPSLLGAGSRQFRAFTSELLPHAESALLYYDMLLADCTEACTARQQARTGGEGGAEDAEGTVAP